MTSKISFHKLVKEDIKKRSWILVLSIMFFLGIMPLFTLLMTEGRMEMQDAHEWFAAFTGFGNVFMNVMMMFGGVVCGITSFSYLHSKSQMDFYHSFPVKREIWFVVTYVGSCIQIIIPYLLGHALTMGIGFIKKVLTPAVFRQWLFVDGMFILFFLLVYNITILAMVLTGKLRVAMMGLVIFLFGGSLAGALKNYTMIQCFETYPQDDVAYGIIMNMLSEEAAWLSPFSIYDKLFDMYTREKSLLQPVVILIICTVLIAVLAFVLYRKRASESAGKAIAFPQMKPFIKVVIAVSAGAFHGIIVGSQNRDHGTNAGWLFGISIFAALLTCAIVEYIYQGDLKMVFKKKWSTVISVLGVTAISIIVQYDVFGYDTYIPEKSEIKTMGIESYAVRDRWACSYDIYSLPYREMFDEIQIEEFEPIYKLAEYGIEHVGEKPEERELVTIAYYLKNGRKVYRSYKVSEDELLKCMSEVMKDEGYREKVLGLDVLDLKPVKTIEFMNFKQESLSLALTDVQKEKLLETYKREVLSEPISTFVQGNVIGRFTIEAGEDLENLESYWGNMYAGYVDTIALMEEYGYQVPVKIEVSDVKMMIVSDYGGTEMLDEEVSATEITDPAEMQKILEHICLNESNGAFPDIYVDITFKNGNVESFSLRKEFRN